MGQTNELRFFWNGIKVGKGKIHRVFYSDGKLANHSEGTISIYSRDYNRFCPEVRAAFTVENNSDLMTDYFETDFIRVEPTHPLFAKVKEALLKAEARRARKLAA